MPHQRVKTTLRLLLAIAAMAMLNACGSSRTVTGNSGHSSTPASSEQQHPSTPQQVEPMTLDGLVAEAGNWIGTRYRYGGNTRDGIDCSGLVVQVYKKVFDISLPRTSRDQYTYCERIKRKDITVGDLVFFATRRGDLKTVSHVGIYIGDNRMIHASSSRGVIISNLDETYYTKRYVSAGRIKALANLIKNARQPQPQAAPPVVATPAAEVKQPTPETTSETAPETDSEAFPDFMD